MLVSFLCYLGGIYTVCSPCNLGDLSFLGSCVINQWTFCFDCSKRLDLKFFVVESFEFVSVY